MITGHFRHHDIQQNQIKILAPDQFQPLPAILGQGIGVTLTGQTFAQQIAIRLVVVHHQEMPRNKWAPLKSGLLRLPVGQVMMKPS
jgi:hypothetical protein